MSESDDRFFEDALKAVEEQDTDQGRWALIIAEIRRQKQVCCERPKICDSKYMKTKHVAVATLIILAFLAGYGLLQAKVLIPMFIKTALAAAM